MLCMVLLLTMFRLNFVFMLEESCLAASGLGYKAKTEKEPEDFNTIRCCKIYEQAFATNPTEVVGNWNMRTQYWLKYYVMIPLLDRSKPKNAVQLFPIVATFMISALWHGFYVGYYGAFAGFALISVMAKVFEGT